jgi:DNA-binding MarR family transcriptional regulator
MTIKKSTGTRASSKREAAGEPEGLLTSTGFLLARLGMESRRLFARMLAEHGLVPHHYGLLAVLDERGTVPQRELGEVIGVDPRNAVAVIDQLEEKRLLERVADPQDRRRYGVRLTPAGQRTMGHLRRAGTEVEREMLQGLDEAERARLHSLLHKLFAALMNKSEP